MFSFKKTIFPKKTIYMKLLVTASLLAIIPVVILGIVSYITANYSLQKEVIETNKETIIQIQNRIDEKLKDTSKFAIYMTQNPTFENFLSSQNPREDFISNNEVMNLLYSFQILNDDNDGIYLYFANQKYLIYSKKTGRNFTNDMSELDPSIKENIDKQNKLFFWMDRKNEDGTYEITLVRNIPLLTKSPDGYLILDMNERMFFKVFSEVHFGQGGTMFIITSSGNIITDPSKKALKDEIEAYPFINEINSMRGNEKILKVNLDTGKALVSCIVSPYNGWKYVTVIPIKEFSRGFQQIKTTTGLICFILVVISFLTSILLSRRFSSVLQGIIEMIKGRNSPSDQVSRKYDELGLIKNYVETLHVKYDSLEREVKLSKPLLKASFLQHMITESLTSKEIGEKFEYYGISKVSNFYTTACMEMFRPENWTEKDENLFLFALMNISQEISDNYGTALIFKTNIDHCAIIFNHNIDEENMQVRVFNIAEEIKDVSKRLLKVTVTIGIGRCYDGVEMIRQSYQEATEALQYQLTEGSGSVIFIGQVSPETSGYTYPIKKEQLIATYIKMGNLIEVNTLVDEFAGFFRSNGTMNYEYVLQSFFQLVASSLRVLYELDPAERTTLFEYAPFKRLATFKTMDQIVSWLKQEVYPVIVGHVIKRRGQRNREIIDRALDYIHGHFDEDLSQNVLAEQVAVPISHFSRLFKEEVGMTFTDYLIAYRVDRAKELLVKTDMKIADIAANMRYNNSQNFIRMFKQFTGLTPIEYRVNHRYD